jgi:hypothetical protein
MLARQMNPASPAWSPHTFGSTVLVNPLGADGTIARPPPGRGTSPVRPAGPIDVADVCRGGGVGRVSIVVMPGMESNPVPHVTEKAASFEGVGAGWPGWDASTCT